MERSLNYKYEVWAYLWGPVTLRFGYHVVHMQIGAISNHIRNWNGVF